MVQIDAIHSRTSGLSLGGALPPLRGGSRCSLALPHKDEAVAILGLRQAAPHWSCESRIVEFHIVIDLSGCLASVSPRRAEFDLVAAIDTERGRVRCLDVSSWLEDDLVRSEEQSADVADKLSVVGFREAANDHLRALRGLGALSAGGWRRRVGGCRRFASGRTRCALWVG